MPSLSHSARSAINRRCSVSRPLLRVAALTILIAAVFGCQSSETPAQAGEMAPSDALLLAAAKIALPPSGLTAADLPDTASPGAKVLTTYCAQCHALPTPGAHSATDWPGVVRRMWLRMDWLPPELGVRVPTTQDRFVLLDYLTKNALQVGEVTLPEGRGRQVFERVCSQCHALPDPRIHSPEDWATVFLRMEGNMERMKVNPPSSDEAGEILSYLQSVGGRR